MLIQSLLKACKLLETLKENTGGISLHDLSEIEGLPKPTVHHLVSTLVHLGLARQNKISKDYFLGFKLVELGQTVLEQLDVRKEGEDLFQELAEKTGETVHLGVLEEGEMLYVEKKVPNKNPVGLTMASRIGLRNPAHTTAIGKVFLAHCSEEELNRIIKEKGLIRKTKNTIIDKIKLKKHLRAVKSQGYALDDEENEIGIRCVAAPIYDALGKVVAVISISGPKSRIDKIRVEKTLIKEVMNTASKNSNRLGLSI